jgi:hypothetical protein
MKNRIGKVEFCRLGQRKYEQGARLFLIDWTRIRESIVNDAISCLSILVYLLGFPLHEVFNRTRAPVATQSLLCIPIWLSEQSCSHQGP